MRAARIYPESLPETSSKSKIPQGTKTKLPPKIDPIFANPEIFMTASEQLEHRGYYVEEHTVETKDGYILTLFRVPYPKADAGLLVNSASLQDRPVALFTHGIASNGGLWFINSEENCLWIEFLKLGFDCWLTNVRGTKYSKTHIALSNKTRKYWDFSYHEMGEFDVPAIIDHILAKTGQQQLFYISHSMGCAILFVASSLHPDLARKIKLMIALAPAVYVSNSTSPAMSMGSKFAQIIPNALRLGFNHGESFLETHITATGKYSCSSSSRNPKLVRRATWMCAKSNELVSGKNQDQVYWDYLPLLAANMPCSLSLRTFDHFLQVYRSKEFQYYDFGKSGNRKKWGQSKPPKYDLQKSTFPVAIFSGKNDRCCQPKDIERLGKELPNVVAMFEVQHPKWTHMDFITAKETRVYLNPQVLQIVAKYMQD